EVYGHVDHVALINAGRNRSNNYTFGTYYTHFSPRGWYADAVAQYTYHDIHASAQSEFFPTFRVDGSGLTGSIEAGYNYCTLYGIGIEPEAQLAYGHLWFHNRNEAITFDFHNKDTDSLLGRLGGRITKSWDIYNSKLNTITGWFYGNVYREFDGDSRTT